MEIARPPQGEKVAQHGAARPIAPTGKNGNIAQQARQHLRDPSAYLFVNEGNETGQFIFILCFPMAPIATERAPLEPERSRGPPDWMKGQGCGELGARLLQLGRQAGRSSPVLPSTLFRFGNFMKKEGRSGTAGGGDSWRALLSRSVAADKPGGGGCGVAGLGGGRESGNDEGRSGERERSGSARRDLAGWRWSK